jgi:hypothetical protein
MTDSSREKFVVEMTDPEDIAHARDLLDGKTHDLPHLIGRISKTTKPYNSAWGFHLQPRSIAFFDVAIEVCDATIPTSTVTSRRPGGRSFLGCSGVTGARGWCARFRLQAVPDLGS